MTEDERIVVEVRLRFTGKDPTAAPAEFDRYTDTVVGEEFVATLHGLEGEIILSLRDLSTIGAMLAASIALMFARGEFEPTQMRIVEDD